MVLHRSSQRPRPRRRESKDPNLHSDIMYSEYVAFGKREEKYVIDNYLTTDVRASFCLFLQVLTNSTARFKWHVLYFGGNKGVQCCYSQHQNVNEDFPVGNMMLSFSNEPCPLDHLRFRVTVAAAQALLSSENIVVACKNKLWTFLDAVSAAGIQRKERKCVLVGQLYINERMRIQCGKVCVILRKFSRWFVFDPSGSPCNYCSNRCTSEGRF